MQGIDLLRSNVKTGTAQGTPGVSVQLSDASEPAEGSREISTPNAGGTGSADEGTIAGIERRPVETEPALLLSLCRPGCG